MDYNFEMPEVRIDPRLRLARHVAFVDVVRELSEEVPDDAVLFYLAQHDVSGLKDRIMDQIWNASDFGPRTSTNAKPLSVINIPNPIRKMAGEFMFSMFIDEMNSLGRYYDWRWFEADKEGMTPLFPKSIRDALNMAYIAENGNVSDHQDVIATLRASVCNEAVNTEQKTRYSLDNRETFWKDQDLDILTVRQQAKIPKLWRMGEEAINRMRMSRHLLSPIEMTSLCNLLDILLVLCYPDGYIEASNAFTNHQYAKMAEVGRERVMSSFHNGLYYVKRLRSPGLGAVNKSYNFYSKISPQAALVVGRIARMCAVNEYCGDWAAMNGGLVGGDTAIGRYLTAKSPSTSSAVALFIKQEVAIQRIKMQILRRALTEYAKGQAAGRGRPFYMEEDACCCDEAVPCGGY